MKTLLKLLSFLGLALALIPSMLVFKGIITMNTHFTLMLVGTVLWFITAPLWMKSKSLEEE